MTLLALAPIALTLAGTALFFLLLYSVIRIAVERALAAHSRKLGYPVPRSAAAQYLGFDDTHR